MKHLVITSRKEEPEGGMSVEFVEEFLENLAYFQELQEEGVIVESGAFPGQHSSYKVFDVEDEDEVREYLEGSPMGENVEHEIKEAIEFSEVQGKLEGVLAKMTS